MKGHSGCEGNEIADNKAKHYSYSDYRIYQTPEARSLVNKDITTYFNNIWNEYWGNIELSQSKDWFPNIDTTFYKKLLRYNKDTVGLLVRYLTGFVHLRRQNRLVNAEIHPSNLCRLCEEDRERAIHILLHCPRLMIRRQNILGYYYSDKPPTHNDHDKWELRKVKEFLDFSNILELEKDENAIPRLNANESNYQSSLSNYSTTSSISTTPSSPRNTRNFHSISPSPSP